MKLWPSSDQSEALVTDSGQFAGRTAEEALARAAAALGPSTDLRCWKTRRGGVAGFFATEVYVAGSTPPKGAERKPARSRRPSAGEATGTDAPAPDGSTDPEPASSHPQPDGRLDRLADLVDGMTDQVSLRHSAIPSTAFRAVLAEAEAVLAEDPELSGPSEPVVPPSPREVPIQTKNERAPAPDSALAPGSAAPPPLPEPESKSRSAPRAPAVVTRPSGVTAHPPGPERIPDLRARLRAIGVPDAYLPRGQRPSIDSLARAMGTLPCAPPLTTREGAVVVVVGPPALADRTADVLVCALGLGRREIVRCAEGTDGTDGHGTARAGAAAKVSAAVRVARRSATGRTSVVTVPTTTGPGDWPIPADVIACLRPDYVLAAVEASAKRADVVHWLDGLGTVDALALWDLDGTRTPGGLLGAAPIAYADGTPCSAISWTMALLARVAGSAA